MNAKTAGGDEGAKKDNVKKEKQKEGNDRVGKTEEGGKARNKKEDHHEGQGNTLKLPHKEGGRSRSQSTAKLQAEK